MSKYVAVDTCITDQDLLVESLRSMGYRPVVYPIAAHLLDYQGKSRSQTAEVIVPRQQVGIASNDIGFKRQPNGVFQRISSEFDNRQKYLNQKVLERTYGKLGTLREMTEKGFALVEEVKSADGEVTLLFEKQNAYV